MRSSIDMTKRTMSTPVDLPNSLGNTGALDATASIPLQVDADEQDSSLSKELGHAAFQAKQTPYPRYNASGPIYTVHSDSPVSIIEDVDGNMGGERDMARLTKPKLEYPVLAQKPVKKMFPKIYLDRIETSYKGGQYSEHNLQALLKEAVAKNNDSVDKDKYVKLSMWKAPGTDRTPFKEAVKQQFDPITVGEVFDTIWSTKWVKVQLTVPESFREKEHLEFHWDAGNEGMVYTEEGHPRQGFSGGERPEWILPESYRDGKEHTFYIEVACNAMFGNTNGISPPDENKTYTLSRAEIVAVNVQARQLYIDLWTIGDAARELPRDGPEQHLALSIVTDMINTIDVNDKSSVLKAREIGRKFLGNVDSADVYKSGTEPMVYGIGHCHIDTCWLWPWAETRRKVARSWTDQCNLMEQYPELNFACSQAQQYKWLKEDYPYVFDRVKEKVKSGQFHPIGGSWVEHDTNMPSGESLVRQFLYGQRFFEKHFGERSQTFWLPDTFGYSAQLPQICRLAGMDRFLTQKLSWNNINNFPHTTFNWVALDGSQVICHMPPAETYTAEAHFGDVKRSITQHKSMDQDRTSLLVFGRGDGGGGPLVEEIEKLRRFRGMSDTVGTAAAPRVHMGNSVDDFFDKLIPKHDKFVTWYGELYFELHRGTYTTQSNNKRNNRASEFLLRAVELYATIASLKNSGYKYPTEKIDGMWENVLLCQFHDCLPGSCIEMCYDDSDKLYAHVSETGKELIKEASAAIGMTQVTTTTAQEGAVLDSLFWPRKRLVELGDGECAVASGDGPILDLQPFKASSAEGTVVSIQEVSKGVFVMQNDQLKVHVSHGLITSVYDRKADREIIAPGGKANQFVIFDDKPLYWQAWDVEVYHLDTRKELTVADTQISENKSFRVAVTSRIKISEKSHLTSTVSLSAALEGQTSFVEVTTEVEWREDLKFLKVEFPVDIRNTEANYEVQYGYVKRPTHYNTDWDMAKFEVCCHKFADLSESNYGVSILNDSKYGFATAGNLMRLSLLRAPKAPDAHADMGHHKIKYAILPHEGPLGPATVRAGYEFGADITLVRKPHHHTAATFASPVKLVGDAAIILDCVKRGEDDEDVTRGDLSVRKGKSVIVRMYESLGGRSRTAISSTWDVKKVTKVNILEDELADEPELRENSDGDYPVTLRPFEVATFRLQL